jgi:hypothetical protein
MCLVGTWHDVDSISFHCLHLSGFQVVDKPRSCPDDLSLLTNHGGVAIVASPDIQLSPVSIDVSPATFNFIAARLVIESFTATVIVIYRPGSVAVQSLFYVFTAILDAVATYQERVFLVGDINIRCDRTDDPIMMQLFDESSALALASNRRTPLTRQVAPLMLL